MTPSPSQRLLPAKSFSEPRTKVSNSPSFSHPSNSEKSDNLLTSNAPVEQVLPDIKKDYSDQLVVSESSVLPISGPIASTSGNTAQSNMEVGEGDTSDTSMVG
jgi:hypothetical protein